MQYYCRLKQLLRNNNKHKMDLLDLLELSGPPTTGAPVSRRNSDSATSKKIIEIGLRLLHLGPIQA